MNILRDRGKSNLFFTHISTSTLIVFWCPKGQTVPRDLLIDYVYCPMAAAYVYCLTFLAQTLYHLYTLISLMKCFILKCY